MGHRGQQEFHRDNIDFSSFAFWTTYKLEPWHGNRGITAGAFPANETI